jgi:hypothetical protein
LEASMRVLPTRLGGDVRSSARRMICSCIQVGSTGLSPMAAKCIVQCIQSACSFKLCKALRRRMARRLSTSQVCQPYFGQQSITASSSWSCAPFACEGRHSMTHAKDARIIGTTSFNHCCTNSIGGVMDLGLRPFRVHL